MRPNHRTSYRVLFAGMLFLGMCLLAGCGSKDETLLKTGMQALAAMDYQTALQSFDDALANGEDEESCYRGRGIACMGLTDYPSAIESFEKALSLSNGIPENMEYDINYYLASCYFHNGQPEDAIAVYNAILSLEPKDATALTERGTVNISLDRFDAADADYRAAIAVEPTNYDRMIRIFDHMKSYGYKEAGQAYLKETIEHTGDTMSDYDKGRLSFYLEDYDAAKTSLERARAANASDYMASSLLGQTYEKLGDFNYAVSVYQAYLAIDQTHAEIYNQLGLCEMQMGNYDVALTSFETGMKITDNKVMQNLSYNEIVAYEHLGEFKKASVLMEAYLAKYPGDATAQREYVFLNNR